MRMFNIRKRARRKRCLPERTFPQLLLDLGLRHALIIPLSMSANILRHPYASANRRPASMRCGATLHVHHGKLPREMRSVIRHKT